MFLAFVISIPLSALLEAPFMNIEKFVLFPARHKEPKIRATINEEFSENSLEKKRG